MTSIWDMAQRKIEAKFSEPYNKVEIAESRWKGLRKEGN
jgi:hypothetical protein